jgi:hypothetical protein
MEFIDSYFGVQIEQLFKAGVPFEVALLLFVFWVSLHVWGFWILGEKIIKGVKNVLGFE